MVAGSAEIAQGEGGFDAAGDMVEFQHQTVAEALDHAPVVLLQELLGALPQLLPALYETIFIRLHQPDGFHNIQNQQHFSAAAECVCQFN